MTQPADPPHHLENDGQPTAGTTPTGASGAAARLEPWLRAIVRCPQCKGELADSADHDALTCAVCRLAYPIENGVPVLLVELAHPLGA